MKNPFVALAAAVLALAGLLLYATHPTPAAATTYVGIAKLQPQWLEGQAASPTGGGPIAATTGAFSGLITSTVASGSPAIAFQTGAKICLDGAACTKYITCDAAGTCSVPGALVIPAGATLAWGSTIGFNGLNTTLGIYLNSAGASAGVAQPMVQGTLDRSITANTNTNAGETTLYTYSLPASTLNVSGRGIRITTTGTTAANGNTKTIRIKFGGTTAFTLATSTSALSWSATVDCVRTGATTQYCTAQGGFGTVATAVGITTPAETLSGAVTILVTGQATTTADITHGLSYTEFLP